MVFPLSWKCVNVAFMSFVCIALYTWSSIRIHGVTSLTFLYEHFPGLAFAALVSSVVLATVTHVISFRGDNTPLLAEGGNTGNHLYDVLLALYCADRSGLLGGF